MNTEKRDAICENGRRGPAAAKMDGRASKRRRTICGRRGSQRTRACESWGKRWRRGAEGGCRPITEAEASAGMPSQCKWLQVDGRGRCLGAREPGTMSWRSLAGFVAKGGRCLAEAGRQGEAQTGARLRLRSSTRRLRSSAAPAMSASASPHTTAEPSPPPPAQSSDTDNPSPNNHTCLWIDCTKSLPDPEALYNHLCNDHIGRKSTNNLCLTCKWKDCGTTCAKRDHITSHLRGTAPPRPSPPSRPLLTPVVQCTLPSNPTLAR